MVGLMLSLLIETYSHTFQSLYGETVGPNKYMNGFLMVALFFPLSLENTLPYIKIANSKIASAKNILFNKVNISSHKFII